MAYMIPLNDDMITKQITTKHFSCNMEHAVWEKTVDIFQEIFDNPFITPVKSCNYSYNL